MLRLIALPATLSLLMSCQMTDPGSPTTTREQRLVLGQTVIDDCVRSECGRLNLDSQLVEDYSQVAALTHVTSFMASYTDFSDLSDIAAMSQLRELHIGQSGVRDLSGLSSFPNLRLLHAQGLSDATYDEIAQLVQLEELAVGRASLTDLSFLTPLRRLKALNLDNATIGSFAGLAGHPSIERLSLNGAVLPDDISGLRSMRNLKQISVIPDNLSDDQRDVIDDLNARGVEVMFIVVAVVVC